MRNILIYDIECATNGASVKDIHLHKFKYVGAYSYKTNKYYFLQSLDELQELIDSHKVIVGFNNYRYDNPILEQHGINFKYKIIIDLYKIIKTRAELIKFKKTFLSYYLRNYDLNTIVKTLELTNVNKIDIDYKMFDIENPTDEQLKKIEEYTIRDIQLTEKLFNYVEKALLDLKKQRKIISPEFKQDVDNEIKTTTSNPGSASQQILDFLSDGKIVSTKELKNKFNDIKIATVRKALLDLKKQKKIISPERAHYAINSLSKKLAKKKENKNNRHCAKQM